MAEEKGFRLLSLYDQLVNRGSIQKKRPRKSLACLSAAFSGILNSFGTFLRSRPRLWRFTMIWGRTATGCPRVRARFSLVEKCWQFARFSWKAGRCQSGRWIRFWINSWFMVCGRRSGKSSRRLFPTSAIFMWSPATENRW